MNDIERKSSNKEGAGVSAFSLTPSFPRLSRGISPYSVSNAAKFLIAGSAFDSSMVSLMASSV